MTPSKMDPFRPADDDARALAIGLINSAAFAALAVIQPGTVVPSVTRVALATTPEGAPMSLISTLSLHTDALSQSPACALLVGEPEPKGDPLTHPRLTIHATARIIARDDPAHATLREWYLRQRPKAKLYADFGDFRYVVFDIADAVLNGGFGKAYRLTRDDLVAQNSHH